MVLKSMFLKLKKNVKKEKLHRILQFICIENDRTGKSGFDSGEIAKAFTPEMDIYEVNDLCRILLDNEDVKDGSTKYTFSNRMVAILVVNATHNAFHNKKYLEGDEEITSSFSQNITGTNIILGGVIRDVKQEANSTFLSEEKPKWLEILYWVIGILVGLTIIITFLAKFLSE
jgi:hypothetical protein